MSENKYPDSIYTYQLINVLKEIVHYHTVSEKKYLDSIYNLPVDKRSNAKANFRSMTKYSDVTNDVLMHGGCEVLVKSHLENIFHAYHDNPTTGGHFGRDKTYAKIAERYHWYGMKKTINDYIQRCKKCFAINPKISKEAPPLDRPFF